VVKPDKTCVEIKRLSPEARIPSYKHAGDSGADLYAVDECLLAPLERRAIGTGLAAAVPPGFELQVRPRSGLALDHGLTVLNTPGTVDSSYRGEIKVILVNLGNEPYQVRKGERIAQLVVAPVIQGEFREVPVLSETERGAGGFGSTGKK
jgi:dUTP pyrophosphatase